jgi:hypothetical protein
MEIKNYKTYIDLIILGWSIGQLFFLWQHGILYELWENIKNKGIILYINLVFFSVSAILLLGIFWDILIQKISFIYSNHWQNICLSVSAIGTSFLAYFARLGYLEFVKGKQTEKELNSINQLLKIINNIDIISYEPIGDDTQLNQLFIRLIEFENPKLINKSYNQQFIKKTKENRNVIMTDNLIKEFRKIIKLSRNPSVPFEVRKVIGNSSFCQNFKFTNYLLYSIPLANDIEKIEDIRNYILLDDAKSEELITQSNSFDRLRISFKDINTKMMKEKQSIRQLERDFTNLLEAINKWLRIHKLEDKQLIVTSTSKEVKNNHM